MLHLLYCRPSCHSLCWPRPAVMFRSCSFLQIVIVSASHSAERCSLDGKGLPNAHYVPIKASISYVNAVRCLRPFCASKRPRIAPGFCLHRGLRPRRSWATLAPLSLLHRLDLLLHRFGRRGEHGGC